MSYPPYQGLPYYAYYNPQQQLYYPYVYSHPHPSQGIPYIAGPANPQGQQAQIDPSLLSGPSAQQPPSRSAVQQPRPASPSDSSDGEDEDDNGNIDRFALHPVAAPSTRPSTSSKEDEDELLEEKINEKDADKEERSQQRPQPLASTTNDVSEEADASSASRRALGNIGHVTGAPKGEEEGALSADEVAKFQSPVRHLNHIDLELFPSRAVFENILYTYQSNLSARKRNKALISRAAYAEIQMTLVEIRESRCRRGTAQYRFWVKKMFGLINFYGNDVVGHQGKPVAIREDIYDILVHCHDQCDHGGRDRTVEVVKDFYRWIPKVIIGEFVKHCPGCSMKRATVKSETSKMPLYDLEDMENMDAMEQMEPDEDHIDYAAQQATVDDDMGMDD